MADILEMAVRHGDEHVIKFADTAAKVHVRAGDPGGDRSASRLDRFLRERAV